MNLEFSSGGAVFKKTAKRIRWLVTRSSPSKIYPHSYWRLPKGWIDDENGQPGPLASGKRKAGEDELQNAASREVKEEAGVEGKIINKIDTIKFFYSKEGQRYMKFVTYYLMEWEKDLPEGFGCETSEIGWFNLENAIKILKHKSEKEIIYKANRILNSGTQENLL